MKLSSALAAPSVRRLLFFSLILALAAGWVGGRWTAPVLGLEISFRNVSDVHIESIQLDFGNADTQSSIQTFRIAPGETRTLALNHSPGMGCQPKTEMSPFEPFRNVPFAGSGCVLRGFSEAR